MRPVSTAAPCNRNGRGPAAGEDPGFAATRMLLSLNALCPKIRVKSVDTEQGAAGERPRSQKSLKRYWRLRTKGTDRATYSQRQPTVAKTPTPGVP